MTPRSILAGLLVAGLCTLGTGSRAGAEIYRWTDAHGKVHFTQNLGQVPANQRTAARSAAEDRNQAPSRLQTYSGSQSATGKRHTRIPRSGQLHQIPFRKSGNAMLVEVRINDRVSAPFLVDTGASDVAIPASVAAQAGISIGPRTPHANYQTANGMVSKPVVNVQAVQVGDVRVENIRGSISESMEVGLLGGSFFNNFTFQIDPAAGVITLVANDRVRSGLSEREWRGRFHELRTKLAALDRYIAENHFARESRVAELDGHRSQLREQIEALENEANAADVPRSWRE